MRPIRTAAHVAIVVVCVGAVLLAWKPLSSYVRTGAHLAGENARSMVPTGFEIERLETLVHDLDQTLAEQRARVVKQEVDLEYLGREVERADDRVATLEAEVMAARRLLATEQATYRIGQRHFARDRVVADAVAKAESLERARSLMAAKAQTRDTLQTAIDQAQSQIAAAHSQREEFALRLAQLRATKENVELRQELAHSLDQLPTAIDRGAFQQVEDAFARVERELEVQSRLLDDHFQPDAGTVSPIDFAAGDQETDVLGVLDRALGLAAPGEVDASIAHLTEVE